MPGNTLVALQPKSQFLGIKPAILEGEQEMTDFLEEEEIFQGCTEG